MLRILLFSVLVFLMVGLNKIWAQDAQFSQFYAAPLYLNPAFAGAAQEARVGINYRNQWPQIDEANFETISAYFDTYFYESNSGVGLIINRDKEGFAGLRSTSVGFQYAYQLKFTQKLTFRAGGQAAYFIRDLNFANLTFGNQFDPNTGTFDPTIVGEPDLLASSGSVSFFDLGLGGLMFTEKWWIGFSVFHLNRPSQSLFDGGDSKLPRRHSLHGGYKILLNKDELGNEYNRKREVSVTPTLQYKFQGDFDQIDLGLYFTYQPIVFGLWYRGLPFKSLDGFSNNEAFVFSVGLLDIKGINIGYSFDYTISDLGIGSGGAHEISFSYTFPLTDRKLPPKEMRFVPCPKI